MSDSKTRLKIAYNVAALESRHTCRVTLLILKSGIAIDRWIDFRVVSPGAIAASNCRAKSRG